MPKFLTPAVNALRVKNEAVERGFDFTCRRTRYSTTKEQVHKPVDSEGRQLQATDLLDVYRGLVAQGRLKYDEEQIKAVMELRRLHKRLTDYAPPALISSDSNHKDTSNTPTGEWWSHASGEQPTAPEVKTLVRLKSHADEIANLDTPKGLLLTGSPGCGKSMLIDLWFSILPTPYKVRKHYSTLILEIYRGVWEETRRRQALSSSSSQHAPQAPWNKAVRDQWRALFASGTFPSLLNPNSLSQNSLPLPSISYSIARRLLLRHWLLVFDEIQLLDVSSAGLLSDVLFWYWRMGGVVVGSSNKVPDDLYRNGVQRERLEPFVEALKLRCPILPLRNTSDYRKMKAAGGIGRTWFVRGQETQFEDALRRLVGEEKTRYDTIDIFGRPVSVRRISSTACLFAFEELCDRSLGPADYISIASRYSTIVLTDVPVLRTDTKNQGRRFISLIDALYESRCRLICISEADLDRLFFPDGPAVSSEDSNESLMMAESISETKESFRPNISSYDFMTSNSSHATKSEPFSLESLSIFSGDEERFAYQRAQSRLREMTSAAYNREDEWRPLSAEARRWEFSSLGSRKEPFTKPSPEGERIHGEDFAVEAAYFHTNVERERPPAPKLSEGHVWGVREDWGPRAKAWGKGAQIYDKNGQESSGTEGHRP